MEIPLVIKMLTMIVERSTMGPRQAMLHHSVGRKFHRNAIVHTPTS
jgi:hypothetical protein